MRLLTRRKTPAEELKDAAIEALVNALDDDKRTAKRGTKGVHAVAAGAVLYTAGRAAFKGGQRLVRKQLSSDTDGGQAEDFEDEEETRGHEEPEAYEVNGEEDEPEAFEDAEAEPGEDVETGHDEPDQDSEELAARREPDDEPRSKPSTPLPALEPMRRAARKKGAQPSLKLPKQRRARIRVSSD
jgi:hypothetical protein